MGDEVRNFLQNRKRVFIEKAKKTSVDGINLRFDIFSMIFGDFYATNSK